MDGEHKAWISVEVDSKEDALRIVPAAFRAQAKVVQLDKFTLEQVESALAQHPS
jgi:nicotinate-nucleotide pyrophosphorylase